MYAKAVWWPMVSRVGERDLLQGSYLRAALRYMETTPTKVLEVALLLN